MGRQSGNIYRTTISVPTDLKARMDAAEDQVNWSAVAVRFEEKLAEIASRKKVKNMDDAIQRPAPSQKRGNDSEHQPGFEAGRQWASAEAEALELEKLEKWFPCTESYDFAWHQPEVGGSSLASPITSWRPCGRQTT